MTGRKKEKARAIGRGSPRRSDVSEGSQTNFRPYEAHEGRLKMERKVFLKEESGPESVVGRGSTWKQQAISTRPIERSKRDERNDEVRHELTSTLSEEQRNDGSLSKLHPVSCIRRAIYRKRQCTLGGSLIRMGKTKWAEDEVRDAENGNCCLP